MSCFHTLFMLKILLEEIAYSKAYKVLKASSFLFYTHMCIKVCVYTHIEGQNKVNMCLTGKAMKSLQ